MKKIYRTLLIGCILVTAQGLSAKGNATTQLTATNYLSTLINSKKPVLVKFWAPWCKPCIRMTPKYKKAAQAFKNKVIFAELNTEDNRGITSRYNIRSIPTLILFRNNKIIAKKTGSLSQKDIEIFVQSSL